MYTEAYEFQRCRKCKRLTRSLIDTPSGYEPECNPDVKPCLPSKPCAVEVELEALP